MKIYFSVLLLIHLTIASFAIDLNVCKGCMYQSINSAIEAASPHDKIIISKGVYNEKNIIIDKPLTLFGNKGSVIDGQNGGDIIVIKSDSVTVEGLSVENSGSSSVRDYAGIKLESILHCTIRNNKLINNYFAIYISNSSNCTIKNNIINGNALKESSSGNGIHLWKSNHIIVEFNQSFKQRDGIYLEFSQQCKINDNLSEGNLRYGLHFMFSHGNTYICNTFRQNGSGVAVMYTSNVEMINNTFEENWGTAAYGLLLKDISKSVIKGNKFIKNTVGVYMEGVSNISLSENEFVSNGWGIKLMGNCIDNKISANNFLGNTFDLVTNSFEIGKQNYTSGNYWDKYQGYDLDGNKIGDVPYHPVSLFSVYVERIPHSVVLLRSFMVNLLDAIEQAVPAVIPETLMDIKPKMQKINL